jgi:hypothetical protein
MYMFFGLEAIHLCFLWTMMMQATMKAIRLEHLNLGVSLAGPVQVWIKGFGFGAYLISSFL